MTTTRRSFLGLCSAALLQGAEPAPRVVDVHHHFYPSDYLAQLNRTESRSVPANNWSLAHSLEDMDAAGIARAMLSISTPGVSFNDAAISRRLARYCNEYAARVASDHKGRFGRFATLPWPDVDASLKEAEYALDTLKADGIGMLTSYGDKWFGDPDMAPLFEELNRRKAIVYTHPTSANCCRNLLTPDIADSAIEYGTDTTRAIARTVFSGTSQKYPDIQIIFSHAGGTMPFLVERFINLAKGQQYASKMPKGFEGEIDRFYYDTAQSSNAVAMAALKKVAPVSQILFGTDYPFRTSAEHVKGLQECGVFTAAELKSIEETNLARLLR